MKIIDIIEDKFSKIDKIDCISDQEKETKDRRTCYSIEFYPPRTEKGKVNLDRRVQKFWNHHHPPLFIDLTWGAGGSTSSLTLELAKKWKNDYHVEVNMHLTCTNMPRSMIDQALKEADLAGIDNLVALRGDPPDLGETEGEGKWEAVEGGFNCAKDLVEYIREKYRDRFGISVAGYPEGHPGAISEISEEELESLSESEKVRVAKKLDGSGYTVCRDEDYAKELEYLKSKVEMGADLVITQLFFDCQVFLAFVRDCRKIGITCPIVPGIMLIQSYKGFFKMGALCKTRVPTGILKRVQKIGDNKVEIRKLGMVIGKEMCQELIGYEDEDLVMHLYTMNLEEVAFEVIGGF